jgi:hypothetical protein
MITCDPLPEETRRELWRTIGSSKFTYGPIPDEIRREWLQLMFDRMKMHYELRQRIRRSAGLPAGNLVTGSFRRPVRRNQRRPRP